MIIRFVILVCLLQLVFTSASYAKDDDPILAKSSQYEFRQSDLDRFLGYSPVYLQKQLKKHPKQKTALIKHMMKQRIIAEFARKEGYDKKLEIKEQIQFMVDDFLAKGYIVETFVEKVEVTDDDVKRYYDENQKEFEVPEQVRAHHILIKVPFGASEQEKEKARSRIVQIMDWLKKGEKFETLAGHYSEDEKTKKQEGDLGNITRGQMPKAFEEVAFWLKPGQISDIVETDYGFHIIRLDEYKKSVMKPYEEVQKSIKTKLTDERIKAAVDGFIDKVLEDAGFEIYEDVIEGKKK